MSRSCLLCIIQDEYSLQYIHVTYCTYKTKSSLIGLFVYLNLIIVPTILLSCRNMRIKSHFGSDGRGTTATIFVLFVSFWTFALIQDRLRPASDPNAYIRKFYFIVMNTLLLLAPMTFLYLPLVSYFILLRFSKHFFLSFSSFVSLSLSLSLLSTLPPFPSHFYLLSSLPRSTFSLLSSLPPSLPPSLPLPSPSLIHSTLKCTRITGKILRQMKQTLSHRIHDCNSIIS